MTKDMVPNPSLSDGVVEIMGDNGAHYLAYVVDVYDPKDPYVMSSTCDKTSEEPMITLRFENDWRRSEAFPLGRIRLLPTKTSTNRFTKGSVPQNDVKHLVEGSEAEVWRSKVEGHQRGFWKCVIKMVKDDFYGVLYNTDDKIDCKVDGKEFNEIVTKDRIRAVNRNPHLTTNPFFKFVVEVPNDLIVMFPNLVKMSTIHNSLRKALKLVAINYDDLSHRLVCIGFADKDKGTTYRSALKGAELLAKTHFPAIRQEMEMRSQIDVLRNQLKNLDEIIQIGDNEFEILVRVEERFMRFAIGKGGANIRRVEQMPNILSIDRVAGVEDNVFKVVGTNRSALRVAKEHLQIKEFPINIPKDLVPHIIGKGGALVQEMTDKSGLIRIDVLNDDSKEKGKTFVPFHLIGSEEAIENAKLLLTFQMNCVKENIEIDKIFTPRTRTDKRR